MEANQINLFKYIFYDGTVTETYNGFCRWGSYVDWIQGIYGSDLTRILTDYDYNNYYLR